MRGPVFTRGAFIPAVAALFPVKKLVDYILIMSS